MDGITMDEVCAIIGAKELEMYQLRKELARTRAVLEQVTSGENDEGSKEATAEAAEKPES